MEIWCRCFISVLISFLGILSFSKSFIDCDGDERIELPSNRSKCFYEWFLLAKFSPCLVIGNLSWQ